MIYCLNSFQQIRDIRKYYITVFQLIKSGMRYCINIFQPIRSLRKYILNNEILP